MGHYSLSRATGVGLAEGPQEAVHGDQWVAESCSKGAPRTGLGTKRCDKCPPLAFPEPTSLVSPENTEEAPEQVHLALQLPELSDKDIERKSAA